MLKEINDCYDCATDEYPCMGEACTMKYRQIHICDSCEAEEDIYYFEDGKYCIECIKEMLMPANIWPERTKQGVRA